MKAAGYSVAATRAAADHGRRIRHLRGRRSEHLQRTTKGNRIYVLDADTGDDGDRRSPPTRGVVADVFVIRDDATGLAKWAYAADMGGNIYRISGVDANTEFGDTDPASWTMTKIASLGCATASTAARRTRKFMMPLDVVEDLDGSYVILVGSGDREKPLQGFDVGLRRRQLLLQGQ